MLDRPIPVLFAFCALGFVMGILFGELIDSDCDFSEHRTEPVAIPAPAIIDLPFDNNGAVREFTIADGTRCISLEGPSGYALSCDWSVQTCQ